MFDVVITSSKLWVSPYSDYQEMLSKKIKILRNNGLTFNAIANFLNDNGYKTPRDKVFEGKHVHSILKKKNIRERRLKRRNRISFKNPRLMNL